MCVGSKHGRAYTLRFLCFSFYVQFQLFSFSVSVSMFLLQCFSFSVSVSMFQFQFLIKGSGIQCGEKQSPISNWKEIICFSLCLFGRIINNFIF